MNWLLSIKKTSYFWALVAVSLVFILASNYFLATEELYYQSYAEQFTLGQIQEIIARANSSIWHYLVYLLIPITIIIRILFTSFCLQAGNLVQESHWKFKELYNIALKADAIYLFNLIGNFYFYAFLQPAKTIQDLNINFLSLLKIKGIENVQSWLVLAFNSINLFEFLYIVLLIIFLKTSFQLRWLKSVMFVLLTYCIGNYLYIVSMTFVYLNFAQ